MMGSVMLTVMVIVVVLRVVMSRRGDGPTAGHFCVRPHRGAAPPDALLRPEHRQYDER